MGQRAAIAAAVLISGVAVFQIGLALGAPWGEMSYGGQADTVDGVLPGSYRVMSAVAVLILLFAAFVVLARAKVAAAGRFSDGFLRRATWVVFGYLTLNTLMNLASSNSAERWGMGSVTVVTAALCFLVARGDREASYRLRSGSSATTH